MIGILCYVIIYSIVIEKGYQLYDPLLGSAVIKVKGSGAAEDADGNFVMVVDSYDLIRPALEDDALFVATSMIMTENQQRGVCRGNSNSTELCIDKEGQTCADRAGTFTDNGMITGECSPLGTWCNIRGWCELEKDDAAHTLTMTNVHTWTTFVKVNIRFPKYDIVRSNTEHGITAQNLFSFDQFVEQSGYSYDSIKAKGTVLVAQWRYDCDLNKDISECEPEITFQRIDDPNNKFSKGFNFRYVDKAAGSFRNETRNLYKVNGIRILFDVTGQGGKFNIVPLLTTFGAGMALLGASTVICDFILQNFLPDKEKWTSVKLLDVEPGHIESKSRFEPMPSDGRHSVNVSDDETQPTATDLRAPVYQSPSSSYQSM